MPSRCSRSAASSTPPPGPAFRENILEKGGSADAMDLYVAFRGRPPTVDALLRHSGIAA